MIGSLNGMLGMKKDSVVNQFVTQMPSKFEVDTTVPAVLSGVVVTVDIKTGKAIGIESVRVIENDLVVDAEGKNE